MPPSQDPIDKMSPADKLLRVGTFGGLALLLLLVTIQSFSEGAPRDPAQQVADAPDAEERVDMASAETGDDSSADMEMAEEEPATETPVETAETAEAEPTAEEPAAEVETAEAEAVGDAAETAEADTTVEDASESTETAEADTTVEDASESTEAAAPDADTTETEVAQADAPAADPMAGATLLASADIDAGESAFRQCSACHQYDNERNGGGPHLVGIVGRDIGAVGDWRYSDALMEAEGVWTPERLNEWLVNPDDYLPGNRMAYPGVSDEQERINIIGFLASQDR